MGATVTSINDAKSRVKSRKARELAQQEVQPPADTVHIRHFVRRYLADRGETPGNTVGRHYGIGNGNVEGAVPVGTRIFFPIASAKRYVIQTMLRGPLQRHLEAVADGGVVFEAPLDTTLTLFDTFHSDDVWNTNKHNVVAAFFVDNSHWQLSIAADGRVSIKTLTAD